MKENFQTIIGRPLRLMPASITIVINCHLCYTSDSGETETFRPYPNPKLSETSFAQWSDFLKFRNSETLFEIKSYIKIYKLFNI